MKSIFSLLLAFILAFNVPLQAQIEELLVGMAEPYGLALDGTTLYYSQVFFSDIKKVDLSSSPLVPEDVATLTTSPPYGILVLDGILYYTTAEGEIYSIDLANPMSAPQLVVNLSAPCLNIISYNNHLYLAEFSASEGAIIKVDPNSSMPIAETVVSGLEGPIGMAIKGDELYISEFTGNAIKKIDLTDQNPNLELVVSDILSPTDMNFYGSFLYLLSGPPNEPGEIYRINTDETNPELIEVAANLGTLRLSAFDGTYFYAAQNFPSNILRLTVEDPSLAPLPLICINNAPSQLGSPAPSGGVFSGPGVIDNGDGQTFSFDPMQAGGVGSYNIVYTLGPNTTTNTIEVIDPPSISFTASNPVIELNAGIQSDLSGGSPMGGVYSGPGVTDNGDGTFTFDPTQAGGLGNYTVTYSWSLAEGCEGNATDVIEVIANPNSVDQIQNAPFKLFPNPVQDILHLEGMVPDLIILRNGQGQRVLIQEQPGGFVQVSELPAGIYFVQIQKDGAIFTDRIVKQ